MGPRLVERGKRRFRPEAERSPELQWGRARLSAERHLALERSDCMTVASMGPRLVERGKSEPPTPSVDSVLGFNGAALG